MSTSATENRRVLKHNIHTIPNLSARFLFFACKKLKKREVKTFHSFSLCDSNKTERRGIGPPCQQHQLLRHSSRLRTAPSSSSAFHLPQSGITNIPWGGGTHGEQTLNTPHTLARPAAMTTVSSKAEVANKEEKKFKDELLWFHHRMFSLVNIKVLRWKCRRHIQPTFSTTGRVVTFWEMVETFIPNLSALFFSWSMFTLRTKEHVQPVFSNKMREKLCFQRLTAVLLLAAAPVQKQRKDSPLMEKNHITTLPLGLRSFSAEPNTEPSGFNNNASGKQSSSEDVGSSGLSLCSTAPSRRCSKWTSKDQEQTCRRSGALSRQTKPEGQKQRWSVGKVESLSLSHSHTPNNSNYLAARNAFLLSADAGRLKRSALFCNLCKKTGVQVWSCWAHLRSLWWQVEHAAIWMCGLWSWI